jgi:hypothetical protein
MISKTLKAIAIAGVLAGATAATAYAYPHTGYQQMLTEHQYNSVIIGGRGQGFNLVVANQRGQIQADGGQLSFVVLLQAGADYRFTSLCDTGCAGLRLSLRDAGGRELASARNDDGAPRINFYAPHTGAYVVTVALTDCRSDRCNVGAVVLGRSAPPPEAGQLPHLA